MIDIGANVGYHSLYSLALGAQHVLAFEPGAHNAGLLAASACLNGWDDGRLQIVEVRVRKEEDKTFREAKPCASSFSKILLKFCTF